MAVRDKIHNADTSFLCSQTDVLVIYTTREQGNDRALILCFKMANNSYQGLTNL